MLAPLGVTSAQWKVLAALEADGPRRISDLVSSLRLEQAGTSRLVDRLERAGFVTRRPEALAGLPGIEVVSGELRDSAQVGRAISGADAVLSAPGTGRDLSPTTVMSEGTASIIAAMKAGGVSRLLAITSGMVTPTGTEPLFFRFIGRHLLRHVHADHLPDLARFMVAQAAKRASPRCGVAIGY